MSVTKVKLREYRLFFDEHGMIGPAATESLLKTAESLLENLEELEKAYAQALKMIVPEVRG